MKITKSQLRGIISEELGRIKESDPYGSPPRPGEQGSADEEPSDFMTYETDPVYAELVDLLDDIASPGWIKWNLEDGLTKDEIIAKARRGEERSREWMKEGTMKIKKSQLRRIIREEKQKLLRESMSYGDAMTQVDQIMTDIRNAGEINWDLSNRLLSIVGNDGSWETDEARSAIHSIEDEGLDALYDAENYIRDALKAQGR
jgi:hypothetical protein